MFKCILIFMQVLKKCAIFIFMFINASTAVVYCHKFKHFLNNFEYYSNESAYVNM